jgi:hypothetical protein
MAEQRNHHRKKTSKPACSVFESVSSSGDSSATVILFPGCYSHLFEWV